MKLKILDLNCWLILSPFSIDNHKRIKKIVSFIKKSNPDIVTLQEVWLNSYIKYFKDHLKNYHTLYNKSNIVNRSGLLTLSKFKPLSNKTFFFKSLSNKNIMEKIAKKGYQRIHFKINNKKFTLVNTHFYAKWVEGEEVFAKKQFMQLKKRLKKGTIILTGDLNLNQKNFIKLNKGFFPYAILKKYPHKKNKYMKTFFHGDELNNHKLDYVLYENNPKKVKIKKKLIKKPTLSDHYPILADLVI